MSSRTRLKHLLSDLKVLKPSLIARRADLQAERFGSVVHSYAVDTNILYFIGQPIPQILSQDKLDPARNYLYNDPRKQIPHTGSLFRSDERHFHLAIGVSLAQFIGFSLTKTSPLLLPNALYPEAQGLLTHFSSFDDHETLAEADRLFLELEKRTIVKIEDKLRQANLDPVDLRELLQRMVQRKIGRHEGLRRIRRLFDGGAIEKLGARPIPGVNHLQGLSPKPQKLGEMVDPLAEAKDAAYAKWYVELKKLGKEKPHLELDALALMQIDLRNRLAHEQRSTERTLFITLDSAIILAAQSVTVDYLNSNFADAFVRHPAAFLNDIGMGVGRTSIVERKTESETVSILDWIDVMANKSSLHLDTQSDDPDGEERAAILIDEIKQGWHKLSDVQEDQLFFQLGIAQIERSLHEKLDASEIADALAKLRDEVIDEEAEAWDNCFRIAIQLALDVEPHDYVAPTRSSPPICFEEWFNAGEAVEQFKIWGARGLSSRQDYEDVRRQLENGEDKSGYSYFLASSAFFAARGDWAPAAGLASFAREQAFRHNAENRRGANGREATYLEAVARQHLVRHSDELARAVELLDECERIFKEERARATGPFEVVPERFMLERLDIDHAKCLFRWDAEEDPEAVRLTMRELLERYCSLQQQLQKQVDRHLVDRKPLVLGSFAYVLVQTEIRGIISAFLLVAVGEIRLDQPVRTQLSALLVRLSVLQAAVSKRRATSMPVETQDSSMLAKVAVAVVSTLVARASGRHPDRKLNLDARKALNDRGGQSHRTFPFDRRRFNAMSRILLHQPAE